MWASRQWWGHPGPSHRRGCRHDADNLAPVILGAHADMLSERIGSAAPVFAREVFGNHGYGQFLKRFVPGEIAPRDDGNAEGLEESGSAENKFAQGRHGA